MGVYGSFALAAFIQLQPRFTDRLVCTQTVFQNETNYIKYNEISSYVNQFCWRADRVNKEKLLYTYNDTTVINDTTSPFFGFENNTKYYWKKADCSNIEAGNVDWNGGPHAIDPRQVVDNLPQDLVIIGIMFMLPRLFWNYTVGAQLQSYLKYIQMLILIIKNKCEKIPIEGIVYKIVLKSQIY